MSVSYNMNHNTTINYPYRDPGENTTRTKLHKHSLVYWYLGENYTLKYILRSNQNNNDNLNKVNKSFL